MKKPEAISTWARDFTPEVMKWLEDALEASRRYHAKGGMSEARVKAQEALLELAQACAVEGDE